VLRTPEGFRCAVSLTLIVAWAVTVGQPASATAIPDLGMTARTAALGDAFVGLGIGSDSLMLNPAGLAWNNGRSLISSIDVRRETASSGHVSATVGSVGLGVHYFDYGDVPEVDSTGNVIGSFEYREGFVVAGFGVPAQKLPFLSRLDAARLLALGLCVKLLAADAGSLGNEGGWGIDVPLLIAKDMPLRRIPSITRASFGLCLRNLLSSSMDYNAGHANPWPKEVVIGGAIAVSDEWLVVVDLTSRQRTSVGVEYSPSSMLSLRAGLKQDRAWMWGFGIGLQANRLGVDLAAMVHRHLSTQFRGTLYYAF